jgi:hypothetical protein
MLVATYVMVFECTKCGKTIPADSVYCPYCGHGMKPSARSTQVSVGGTLMIAAAGASLVFFVLSVRALLNIYQWYPALVAQSWFAYDQMFTFLSFTGLMSGLSAAILSLTRKNYNWTIASALLCTFSGGGVWIISLIIPHSNLLQSVLFYFLPLLAPSFVGTALIFFRKVEFKIMPKNVERG